MSMALVFIRSLALVADRGPFGADLTPLESFYYESEPGRIRDSSESGE